MSFKHIIGYILLVVVAYFVWVNFFQSGAVKYNNQIVDEDDKYTEKLMDFSDACYYGDSEKIDSSLEALQEQAELSLEKLIGMAPYEDDEEFLPAAIEVFEAYKSGVYGEYVEIAHLCKFSPDQFSSEDQSTLNDLADALEAREEPLFKALRSAQRKFAKKHDLDLETNIMDHKITMREFDRSLKRDTP